MMRTLFPNCQTVLQVGAQDYVFVLQQDKYTSVRAILSDTIEAVEYDFGLRLSNHVRSGLVSDRASSSIRLDQSGAGICLRLGGVRVTKVFILFSALSLEYGRKTCGLESH